MIPPKQLNCSANNVLTFQPGGVAKYGQYTTFADLYAAFLLTEGNVFVGIDASIAAASSDVVVYDWQNRVVFGSVGDNFSGVFGDQLTIPDGAQFRNVLGLTQNLQLNTQGSALPSLAWDGPTANFHTDGSCAFLHTGTLPAMEIAANQILYSVLKGQTNLNNFGSPAAMFGLAATTSQLVLSSFEYTAYFTNNLVSGPVGSQLSYLIDASWFGLLVGGTPTFAGNPTNPNFFGTTQTFFADNAPQVAYKPAVPGNWSPVPAQVAQALDELAAEASTQFPIPVTVTPAMSPYTVLPGQWCRCDTSAGGGGDIALVIPSTPPSQTGAIKIAPTADAFQVSFTASVGVINGIGGAPLTSQWQAATFIGVGGSVDVQS